MTTLDFMQWLEARCARPVVVVQASPAVEQTSHRNGMSFVQLLRPFSVYRGGTAGGGGGGMLSVRPPDRHDSIQVHGFGVRLVRLDGVGEVLRHATGVDAKGSRKAAGEGQLARHVQRSLRQHAAMDFACGEQLDRALHDLLRPPADTSPPSPPAGASGATGKGIISSSSNNNAPSSSLSSVTNTRGAGSRGGGPLPRPQTLSAVQVSTLVERAVPHWVPSVTRDVHQLTRLFDGIDTLDAPVGCIAAASTSEPGGLSGVLAVFRQQTKAYLDLGRAQTSMDKEQHVFYVLVHDRTAGPPLATVNDMYAAVQNMYRPAYCGLLQINSVDYGSSGAGAGAGGKSLDPTPWVEATRHMCLDVISLSHSTAERPLRHHSVHPTFTVAVTRPAATTADPSSPDAAAAAASTEGSVDASRNDTATTARETRVTGCCLSPQDVGELQRVMDAYLARSLLKFLEQRLAQLDGTVRERRTTTLGKVAAWFKGKEDVKPRADIVFSRDGVGPPQYAATSVELQMRRCGDLSLAVHDWEGAIGYYKMCLDELLEYLPTRPYNRSVIGGCEEGIAVAQMFLGRATLPSLAPWATGVTRQGVKSNSRICRLELSVNDYVAGGAPYHALRAVGLLVDYCRTRSPPANAPAVAALLNLFHKGVLSRHSVLSGVLFDLTAGLSLFENPPYPAGLMLTPAAVPANFQTRARLRTYAKFLFQAGRIYTDADVPEMAVRVYLRLLELFRGLAVGSGSWVTLYEFILTSLAQQYFLLREDVKGIAALSAAVAHGTPLFASPSTAPAQLQQFWRRYKRVLQRIGFELCPHMPLPLIDKGTFRVSCNTHAVDTTTKELSMELGEDRLEAAWAQMEEALRKADPAHFNTAHTGPQSPQARLEREQRRRYVFRSEWRRAVTASSSATSASGGGGGGGGGSHQQPRHFPPLRSYRVPLSEPLQLFFTMANPTGAAVTAERISILYVAAREPSFFWKSSETRTVSVAARGTARVGLRFDPHEEGVYVLLGLCWWVDGQEGYYYFATREDRPGCGESLFEYAMMHPVPRIDAEENITVTVLPPRARVVTSFHPPLPPALWDGQTFTTTLRVHNQSKKMTAQHVVLQPSPANAHLMWIERLPEQGDGGGGGDSGAAATAPLEFIKNGSERKGGEGKEVEDEGEDGEGDACRALLVRETLGPLESIEMRVRLRAQHDRSDITQRCYNHVLLLLAYLTQQQQTSDGEAAKTKEENAATTTTSSTAANDSPAPVMTLRVHRYFRRVEVRPTLALYSTVLPPLNELIAVAVVVTVKNISPRSVRVARLLLHHHPHWDVRAGYLARVGRAGGLHTLLAPGASLTLPFKVLRRGTAATAAAAEPEDDDADTAKIGGNGARLAMVDTVCLPLEAAAPSPEAAAAIASGVGGGVAGSPEAVFFMSNAARGAGALTGGPARGPGGGSAGDDGRGGGGGGGGFAFYLDGAGGRPQLTAEERLRQEHEQQRRTYGALLERYPPVAAAVAWSIEGGNRSEEGERECGQLFHFVDPMQFLGQDEFQRQAESMEAAAAAALVARTAASSSVSVADQQQRLCRALVAHRSVRPAEGAVAYTVDRLPRLETTALSPAAAVAPLTVRCLSLAPLPVVVEVTARERRHGRGGGGGGGGGGARRRSDDDGSDGGTDGSAAGGSLVIVGKVSHAFVLLPGDTHAVPFTAHILVPGVVECNVFRVRVTPTVFMPQLGVASGLSRAALVRLLKQQHERQRQLQLEMQTMRGAAPPEDEAAEARDSFYSTARGRTDAALQRLRDGDTTATDKSRMVPPAAATGAAGGRGNNNNNSSIGGASVSARGSFSNSSLRHGLTSGGAAAVSVGAALQQLRPKGFAASQISVVGHRLPAPAQVLFRHPVPSVAEQVERRLAEVAAAATAASVASGAGSGGGGGGSVSSASASFATTAAASVGYAGEYERFERQMRKFENAAAEARTDSAIRQKQQQQQQQQHRRRSGSNAAAAAAGDEHAGRNVSNKEEGENDAETVHFTYRPLVRAANASLTSTLVAVSGGGAVGGGASATAAAATPASSVSASKRRVSASVDGGGEEAAGAALVSVAERQAALEERPPVASPLLADPPLPLSAAAAATGTGEGAGDASHNSARASLGGARQSVQGLNVNTGGGAADGRDGGLLPDSPRDGSDDSLHISSPLLHAPPAIYSRPVFDADALIAGAWENGEEEGEEEEENNTDGDGNGNNNRSTGGLHHHHRSSSGPAAAAAAAPATTMAATIVDDLTGGGSDAELPAAFIPIELDDDTTEDPTTYTNGGGGDDNDNDDDAASANDRPYPLDMSQGNNNQNGRRGNPLWGDGDGDDRSAGSSAYFGTVNDADNIDADAVGGLISTTASPAVLSRATTTAAGGFSLIPDGGASSSAIHAHPHGDNVDNNNNNNNNSNDNNDNNDNSNNSYSGAADPMRSFSVAVDASATHSTIPNGSSSSNAHITGDSRRVSALPAAESRRADVPAAVSVSTAEPREESRATAAAAATATLLPAATRVSPTSTFASGTNVTRAAPAETVLPPLPTPTAAPAAPPDNSSISRDNNNNNNNNNSNNNNNATSTAQDPLDALFASTAAPTAQTPTPPQTKGNIDPNLEIL